MESGHTLIVERNLSTNEDIKDDAEAPYVDFWASVDFGVEEFRCCKVQRTTEGGEMGNRVIEVRETKVDYLDVSRFRYEYVLDFEITMDDVVAVQVVECTANLASKLACDAFAQSTVADDVVEHLTAVDVLKDHVVMMLMDNHLTHPTYVGVVEQHGEGSLTDSSDFLGSVLGGLLCDGLWGCIRAVGYGGGGVNAGEYFYGKLLLCDVVYGELDLSHAASAEGFCENVVAEDPCGASAGLVVAAVVVDGTAVFWL